MVSVLAGAALVAAGCQDDYSRLKTTRQVRFISEEETWSLALKTSLPIFPAASLRAGTSGPAVATLLITSSGAVLSSKVLQAPDRASAEAFQNAVSGWQFQQREMPEGKLDEGTVTLYFEIRNGSGAVLTAPEKVREMNPAVKTWQTRR